MQVEWFATDVAPDGAGKLFWAGFYKDVAPTALDVTARMEAKAPCRADLSHRSRTKAEVKRRRKHSTTERGGREAGGMANYF